MDTDTEYLDVSGGGVFAATMSAISRWRSLEMRCPAVASYTARVRAYTHIDAGAEK